MFVVASSPSFLILVIANHFRCPGKNNRLPNENTESEETRRKNNAQKKRKPSRKSQKINGKTSIGECTPKLPKGGYVRCSINVLVVLHSHFCFQICFSVTLEKKTTVQVIPRPHVLSGPDQSRRHGGTLVGLSPQTKLQTPQIEIWNIISWWNFCQIWMSIPPVDDFLATVLVQTSYPSWRQPGLYFALCAETAAVPTFLPCLIAGAQKHICVAGGRQRHGRRGNVRRRGQENDQIRTGREVQREAPDPEVNCRAITVHLRFDCCRSAVQAAARADRVQRLNQRSDVTFGENCRSRMRFSAFRLATCACFLCLNRRFAVGKFFLLLFLKFLLPSRVVSQAQRHVPSPIIIYHARSGHPVCGVISARSATCSRFAAFLSWRDLQWRWHRSVCTAAMHHFIWTFFKQSDFKKRNKVIFDSNALLRTSRKLTICPGWLHLKPLGYQRKNVVKYHR